MTRKGILITVTVCLFSLFGISESYSQVVVRVKPARAKVVVVKPHRPGKKYVWVEGHWKWNQRHHRYVWVKGKWIRKPRYNSVWIAGRWKKVPGGFKYIPGHWA